MNHRLSLLTLLCFAISSGQEPLNNESILKMVKAGLSEDVIANLVKTQPARYAVTPDQLIELKAAGVPDKVVAAMVEKTARVGAVPSGAVGNVAQVQYRGPTGLVALQQPVVLSEKSKMHILRGLVNPLGVSPTELLMVYKGAQAPLQIHERTPTFVVNMRGVRPEDLFIARVEQKNNTREIQVY